VQDAVEDELPSPLTANAWCALASTIGGMLFDASGYRAAFMTSATLLLRAALPAWASAAPSLSPLPMHFLIRM